MPIGPVQHGAMEKRCALHKNHPGWPNKGAGFYHNVRQPQKMNFVAAHRGPR